MPALDFVVDQNLVDEYLDRVNRFHNNVVSFEDAVKKMLNNTADKTAPVRSTEPVMESYHESEHTVPVPEETPAAQPNGDVVRPEDIDLDKFLAGIDLGGGISL